MKAKFLKILWDIFLWSNVVYILSYFFSAPALLIIKKLSYLSLSFIGIIFQVLIFAGLAKASDNRVGSKAFYFLLIIPLFDLGFLETINELFNDKLTPGRPQFSHELLISTVFYLSVITIGLLWRVLRSVWFKRNIDNSLQNEIR